MLKTKKKHSNKRSIVIEHQRTRKEYARRCYHLTQTIKYFWSGYWLVSFAASSNVGCFIAFLALQICVLSSMLVLLLLLLSPLLLFISSFSHYVSAAAIFIFTHMLCLQLRKSHSKWLSCSSMHDCSSRRINVQFRYMACFMYIEISKRRTEKEHKIS